MNKSTIKRDTTVNNQSRPSETTRPSQAAQMDQQFHDQFMAQVRARGEMQSGLGRLAQETAARMQAARTAAAPTQNTLRAANPLAAAAQNMLPSLQRNVERAQAALSSAREADTTYSQAYNRLMSEAMQAGLDSKSRSPLEVEAEAEEQKKKGPVAILGTPAPQDIIPFETPQRTATGQPASWADFMPGTQGLQDRWAGILEGMGQYGTQQEAQQASQAENWLEFQLATGRDPSTLPGGDLLGQLAEQAAEQQEAERSRVKPTLPDLPQADRWEAPESATHVTGTFGQPEDDWAAEEEPAPRSSLGGGLQSRLAQQTEQVATETPAPEQESTGRRSLGGGLQRQSEEISHASGSFGEPEEETSGRDRSKRPVSRTPRQIETIRRTGDILSAMQRRGIEPEAVEPSTRQPAQTLDEMANREREDAESALASAVTGIREQLREAVEPQYNAWQEAAQRAAEAYDRWEEIKKSATEGGAVFDAQGAPVRGADIQGAIAAAEAEYEQARQEAADLAAAYRKAMADAERNLDPDTKIEQAQAAYDMALRRLTGLVRGTRAYGDVDASGYTDQEIEYTGDWGTDIENERERQLAENYLTDDQKKTMAYYRSIGHDDWADDYYKAIRQSLQQQREEDTQAAYEEFGRKYPILGSVASVPVRSLTGVAAGIENIGSMITGEYDPYTAARTGLRGTGTVRAGAKERMLESGFAGKGRELVGKLGLPEETVDNALTFIYDTGISVLGDSTFNAMVLPGGANLGVLGLTAFSDTVDDMITNKGADVSKAMALGVIAGAAEIVTEKMRLDDLTGLIGGNSDSTGIRLIRNMLSEAGEEGTSEIINIISECLIMGDESDYEQKVAEYMGAGMDEEAARKKAIVDIVVQVAEAGAGGALGGFMGGSVEIARGQVQSAGEQRSVNKMAEDYGGVVSGLFRGLYNRLRDSGAWARQMNEGAQEGQETRVVDAQEYKRVFDTIFEAGQEGASFEEVQEQAPELVGLLTQSGAERVWQAGQQAATEAQAQQEQPQQQSTVAQLAQETADQQIARTQETVARTQETAQQARQAAQEAAQMPERPTARQTQTQAQEAMESRQTAQQEQMSREERVERIRQQYMRSEYDPQQYRRTFDALYGLGGSGMSYEGAVQMARQSGLMRQMDPAAAQAIWQAGRNEAIATVTPGVTKMYTRKLNWAEKRMVRLLDEVGRDYGLQIVLVDSLGGRANGMYQPGGRRIVVAADAMEGSIAQAGIHEMVHFIRSQGGQAYNILADTVVEHLRASSDVGYDLEEAIIERQKDYAEQIRGMSKEEARDYVLEEIVAEATSAFLADEQAVRQFTRTHRGLAEKVRDFLRDFVKRINQIVDRYAAASKHNESLAMISRGTDALVQLADFFDTALKVASEDAQAREAAGEQQLGEMRTSGTKWSAAVFEGIEASAEQTFAQWCEYVMEMADEEYYAVKQKMPVIQVMEHTPEILQKYGAKDRKIVIRFDALYPAIRNSGALTEKEVHYHSLGKKGMLQIVEGIKQPDALTRNPKGRITVFTHAETETGQAIASIELEDRKDISGKHETVNLILTAFGVGRNYVKNLFIKHGNVLIYENEAIPQVNPQLHEWLESINGIASTDTVPYSPQEVKPEITENHRFSLNAPVERVRDLVAVHNLNESKLDQALKLGGLAMPSIAITRADVGHSDFGSISLVFDSDTINPAKRGNRVFSRDAWTTTTPQVETEINSDRAWQVRRQLEAEWDNLPASLQPEVRRMENMLQKDALRAGEDPVETAMANPGVMAVYLRGKGEEVTGVYDTVASTPAWDTSKEEAYIDLFEALDIKTPEELEWIRHTNGREVIERYAEALNQFEGTKGLKDLAKWRMLKGMAQYFLGEKTGESQVENAQETEKAVRERINVEDYRAWVEALLEGVTGETGIVRDVDPYTPSGNRKTFKQTHMPYTLENLLKEMKKNSGKGVQEMGASFGQVTGAVSEEYKTLNQIREAEGRIQPKTEAGETKYNKLNDRYYDLATELGRELFQDYPAYSRIEVSMGLLLDAAKGSLTAEAVQKVFAKEGKTIDTARAEEIASFLREVRELPTDYFEAKPERAVTFDEVKAAIVPDNMNQGLRDRLTDAGVGQVITYKAGDEEARKAALNGLNELKFSLNTASDGGDIIGEDGKVKMPIDIQIDQAEVQRIAQTAFSGAKKIADNGVDYLLNQKLEEAAAAIRRDTRSKMKAADLSKAMVSLIQEYARSGATAEAFAETTKLARDIIDQSTRLDDSVRKQYEGIRKTLRETPISLTDTQKQETANYWGSYGDFRKLMQGTVRIANGGISLDALWAQLAQQAPEFFPMDTNEAQMPERLATFREAMKPRYVNNYGMDTDAASADLALRIQGDILAALGASKQAKQMYGMRQQYREAYQSAKDEQIKETNRQRVAAFRGLAEELRKAKATGNTDAYKHRMEQYRRLVKQEGMAELIAEANSNRIMMQEQTAKNARARERVMKKAESLLNMIAKPTKAARVPTMLQQTVLDVLNALDLSGKGGRETMAGKVFADKLTAITDYYQKVLNAQSKGESAEGMDGQMMAICERNVAALKDAVAGIIGEGKVRISDLDYKGLRYMETLLSTVQHSIDSINTLWRNARYESVSELAASTMDELDSRKERTVRDKTFRGAVSNFLLRDMVDPETFGEIMGEAGKTVTDSLLKGENVKFGHVKEAAEYTQRAMKDAGVKGRDIGAWRGQKSVRTFTLASGQTAKLTGSMVMSLYLTAKRPQGLQHLLGNGMRIMTTKETGNQVRTLFLTPEDITAITSTLTEEQRAMADAMQRYLATDVAKWGNDVTQRMYLFDAFTEDTYWPLTSDPNVLKTQEPTADRNLTALTSPGFMKPLNEYANNPVILQDAFDVYGRHISEMASYAGLAEPISDALAMLNYKRKNADGLVTGTVKESMERALGKSGISYLTTLIQDLNGARHGERSAMDTLLRNYKTAAVMGKIRVVIQQPTSIFRASMEMNPAYLAAATFRHVPKKYKAEMLEHSKLAWWKANGNYDTGMGRSMDQMLYGDTELGAREVLEKASSFGGLLDPGKADDWAWVRMWQAVKLETKRTRPDLEVGSDAYWKHVTERFEKIMDRTQVVDTVAHRSQMMRSTNAINKVLTSFQAEPTKGYNLLLRAILQQNRNPSRENLAKVARAGAVYVLGAGMTALAKGLVDAFRYRDDDDDLWEYLTEGDFAQDYIYQILNNWIGDALPWRNMPLVGDALGVTVGNPLPEFLAKWATGQEAKFTLTPETYELPQLQGLADLLPAAMKVYNYLEDNSKHMTPYGAVKPMLAAMSELFGLPINGMANTVETLGRIYDPRFLASKMEYTTTGQTYEALYKAILRGDTKKAEKIRAELREGKYGVTEKTSKAIDTGLANILAEQDDRVREAYEMLQEGRARDAKELIREIAAQGFGEDTVEQAVNRYKAVQAGKAKQEYQQAMGAEDEAEASRIMQEAVAAGYATQEQADKWLPSGEDQELSATLASQQTLLAALSAGSKADAKAVIADARAAGRSDSTIAGWVRDEYKDKYLAAVQRGNTDKAKRIQQTLTDLGLTTESGANAFSDTTVMGWINEVYKPQYIALWQAGKYDEARALGRTLQALGLTKTIKAGEVNCFRDDYLKNWQKEAAGK